MGLETRTSRTAVGSALSHFDLADQPCWRFTQLLQLRGRLFFCYLVFTPAYFCVIFAALQCRKIAYEIAKKMATQPIP